MEPADRLKVWRVLSAVFVLACAFGRARPADAKSGVVVYVSPDGRDDWSGRVAGPTADGTDGPLASIAGARDAIRRLRGKHGRLLQPVTVEIADGTYRIGGTIVFEPPDGGTKDCPITYRAAPGARPVISGARAVTGWKKDASSGLWTARVPKVRSGRWYFRQLFVDGVRYVRARDPNEKDLWYRFAKTLYPPVAGAICEHGDVKAWRKGDEVEAVLMRTWDTSRFRVLSLEPKSMIMRFQVPEGKVLSHWKGDRRYYLENSLSFLDSPGEWFLDRKTGALYLRAFDERDVARAEILAPALKRLLRLDGRVERPVEHICFRGLTFRHSSWTLPRKGYDGHYGDLPAAAAIEGDFVRACSFEECRFEHLGAYAIWLREGCSDNKISRCEFTDIGGGAVAIGESKRADRGEAGHIRHETRCNEISRNHVYECGRVYHGSVGIWVSAASGNRISRNHLHDLPYSGISVGWVFDAKADKSHHNIIEFNRVHDVMQSMSDGAGIYTMGVQPGTVIRDNVIHDCPGWEPMRWASGIYMDLRSSEMLVENNLVCRLGRWGLIIGGGKHNIIRNNIFALPGAAVILASDARGNRLERNIFLAKKELFARFKAGDGPPRMDYNVYWRADGKPLSLDGTTRWAEWQRAGRDAHSLEADPGFVDPANGDFALRADSAAIKLGFKPFKLPRIGPPAFDYSSRISASMRRSGPERMTRWPLPRIRAFAPSSEIVIDGRLREKAWKDIEPVPLAETKKGKPHESPLHYARVACDGENLFVAIVTNVPDMSRLHADGKTWDKHDWAVVCFQGVSEEKVTPVFTVWGWASGAMQALEIDGETRRRSPALERACRFAATVGENKWIAEWKIPLTVAGIDPFKVKQLRFNLGVRRSDAPDEKRKWGMWVNTGFYVWHLRHAGVLVVEKAKD